MSICYFYSTDAESSTISPLARPWDDLHLSFLSNDPTEMVDRRQIQAGGLTEVRTRAGMKTRCTLATSGDEPEHLCDSARFPCLKFHCSGVQTADFI